MDASMCFRRGSIPQGATQLHMLFFKGLRGKQLKEALRFKELTLIA